MAYFDRTDERDKLIVCNICNVKVSERSMSGHRLKCCNRHAEKFERELLFRCRYDSGHIVKKGQLDNHYEFCTKRQSKLVEEFQIVLRAASRQQAGLPLSDPDQPLESVPMPKTKNSELEEEDWSRAADEHPYEFDFGKLRLDN